jgi:uncharacterized protein YjbJ (UPF0337 family)
MVNKDQVKGRIDQVAGKAKRVAGAITGHGLLERKGRLQEVAGKARATYGDTKEDWKDGKGRLDR